MTGYIPINEACVQTGMSLYMLNKYIGEGKVRVKDTTDITKKGRSRVRYVSCQDILDVQSGLALSYVDIKKVHSLFGIAPQVVRYQIKRHRLRWRREGESLMPCVADLELYAADSARVSASMPKEALARAPGKV